ncbi:plexin-D1 isoform X1 [Erpetoichthys calabaricus]|uniref:plexin-D1 isoform X1 n=1 Tax=Erpetoichthys calabaricus TaxID=27687 RepID=UPI002234AB9E|nr:plexin-D1 isoform X1 [Erpetoichthys calabaricus]
MSPRRKVGLLAWILSLLALMSTSAGGLQLQQKYTLPKMTNNFEVDTVSRKVYVAAVNSIYQLNSDLTLEVEQMTGPVEDNRLCHAPELPQASCDHPKVPTDNHNKLLALDRGQGVAVVCGSVYQGFCELRNLDNISQIAVKFPPKENNSVTVFPSMLNIAANHPNASTVGLILRTGGTTRLLVGATYTGVGTPYFPKNHSKEDLRFENTPEIAIRSLNIHDLPRLFTYDINPSEENVFKIKQEKKQMNKLSFVRAFIQKTYTYIVMNNDANLSDKESQPNSVLARICLDTENPRKSAPESKKLTESYIQMGLQCGYSGNVYNRVVSVFSGRIYLDGAPEMQDVLFGVFEKGNKKSAVCVFRFADIEKSIRDARQKCLNTNSMDVTVLDSVIQGTGAGCSKNINIVLQQEHLDCGAAHLQHPLEIRTPLNVAPVFEASGLTSVAVSVVNNYTVMFLGTASGKLRKLTLLRNLTVGSQKFLRVAPGESVHHIMTFDPSDSNYLYLMTSYQIMRVKVARCDQFTTCRDCLEATDPHCGWCTLENRCSLQKECRNWNQPNYWISLSDGIQSCPSMEIIPERLHFSHNTPNIGILIDGSIPDLKDTSVCCDFGNKASTPVVKYNMTKIYTCPLLPKEKYPAFPPGQDHITISTSIRANGTGIVWGNFTIYDCERTGNIDPKRACYHCLDAKWKCYWDVKRFACVSNNSDSKNQFLIEEANSCPQLSPTKISPAATGNTLDIIIHLTNAAYLQEKSLECDFGGGRTYDARWIDMSSIICSGVTLYTAEISQHIPVHVRLKENPEKYIDNLGPLTVEIYNCASGSSDCSKCWGRQDLEHNCVWCENSCRPRSDCKSIQDTCSPPEIRKILPLNGPLEGGTLVTIQGRNLGRRFSDVTVVIGEVKCQLLPERYIVSEEIICETAAVTKEFSDVVTVKAPAEGKSREKFSYVIPTVQSIKPDFGPKAGGTKVVIGGTYLDVGSKTKVLVNGSKECTILEQAQSTISCIMPEVQFSKADVYVCVQFENNTCIKSNGTVYRYMKNPVISDITPKTSHLSGGRTITVHGQDLLLIQDLSMKVASSGQEQVTCAIQSNTIALCPSPAVTQASEEHNPAVVEFYINSKLYTGDGSTSHSFLDDEDIAQSGKFNLEYFEDPQFYTANKEKWIKHHEGEPLTLVIMKGTNNLNFQVEEYKVMIGSIPCEISFISEKSFHCTINGSLSSTERELPVIVQVGKLKQTIATVHLGGIETAIVISIVVCGVLLLACSVALAVFCTKSRRAERYWQKTLLQMEEMESQIREEIRKGFAELQTDMTDLTKELNRSQGIPFLEYKHFVTRTFFPKMCSNYERSCVQPIHQNQTHAIMTPEESHPLLQEWKSCNQVKPNMEEGITLFSTLLNNKHFLITFVHALEQQKDFAVRDRCNLASLLTIALHGKLEYFTSIMKDLLIDLIDASASKNPKLMLRRTESVVEKMLTNWMSICMYSYLKETVGEPFFLLLCAIKQQINKGSIDAITGKARYTLNEEWLLRENIEAKPLNINVSFQGCGMDSLTVRVMNTDTVSQVKEKILEAFYKNLPFSQWPRVEDVDLEWFASSNDSRILRDLDDTSVMEDGKKKLNAVSHYKIPDGASLAMSLKDKRDDTLGRVKDLDTEKYFHLVLPNDEQMETRKSYRQSHRKKVLPEIYLTRLLSTKGTLQKFLDDLFQAILSIPKDKPPFAVKYFFDFLEEQADKRGITDPDTLHIWKTNSLPLRFWVNILKNPQFVFDIDKTDHMDACLSVIAQAFIDACSISDLQLGKDSPTNKLLYAKEIPEYKKTVQRYYQQIQEMTPLSEQEMNAHLAEESRKYRNEFNTNLALTEIYNYAKRYRTQVVSALDANPTTRRTQLQHKFEQVIALVEDNIYECSSEA